MRLRQSTISVVSAAVIVIMALLLAGSVYFTNRTLTEERQAEARRAEFKQLGIDLATASDYLTDEARKYVVTADDQHLNNYWNEINVTKNRDRVLARLKELGATEEEFSLIALAKQNSDALVNTESRAMRLMLESRGVPEAAMPPAIAAYQLSQVDRALGPAEKVATARTIMFDAQYAKDKAIIMGPIAEFQTKMNTRAAGEVEAARDSTRAATRVLMLLTALFPAATGAVLWVFYRWLGKPVTSYTCSLSARRTDELDFALTPAGTEEVRKLAEVFNRQFRENQEQLRANRSLMQEIQALAVEVAATAGQVNDTSARLVQTAGHTGTLVDGVSTAIQGIAVGAQGTSRSAQVTNTAVDQLTRAIDAIARGAADQARHVQTTSETTARMTDRVEQVAASAGSVADASAQARAAAQDGARAVQDTVAGMTEIQVVVGRAAGRVEDLGRLGEKIGAVVETIDDIAEQTNLLALNAAIEAARAGEHGRGFAVVADEVRKLAERSQRETKAIAGLIAQVQSGTREAVAAMQLGTAHVEDGAAKAGQAGEALNAILNVVEATASQVQGIARAAEEMTTGAHAVVEAMESMSAAVEESTAATEEMVAQSTEVNSAIESIAAVAEENTAATDVLSQSADKMSAQVQETIRQAEELAATARRMRALVSRLNQGGGTAIEDATPPLRVVA